MRTLLLIMALGHALLVRPQGAGLVDPIHYGRHPSARAEALGGGDMAMQGDIRTAFHNPASLLQMQGLEAYAHGANPYYFLRAAHYADAALAYRLGDRFAVAAHYNRFDWNWAESGFILVDPVGNPQGAWGPGGEDRIEQYALSVAGRLTRGLSVGLQGTWIRLGFPLEIDAPFASASAQQVIAGKANGVLRHSFRLAAAWQNISGERLVADGEDRRGFSYDINERMPSTARLAGSAMVALHKGWLNDSLRSVALSLHVQYDDDVNYRYRSAFRAGVELEVLGIVMVRAGWFRQDVNDYGWPEYNKDVLSDVTYGVGLNLPVQQLTKGKLPVTITLDYARMPQVSYTQDDLSPFTDEPWDDFESFGLRVNYGLGLLYKKKPAST